jgi:hypothetical protein
MTQTYMNQTYLEGIEKNIINPEWNWEKITEETSSLVHLTKECCFNCINWDIWNTGREIECYSNWPHGWLIESLDWICDNYRFTDN